MQKEPIKPVLAELVRQAKEHDEYRLLVYHCYEDLYYENPDNIGAAKLFDTISYDMIDVMIMMQTNEMQTPLFNNICERCNEKGIPVISIDLYRKTAFNVSFAYGEAFSSIVEHLITEHGCKDLMHMAGTKGNDFAQTRIDSFAETVTKHGLAFSEDNVLYGDFWDNPTYAAMDAFFESGRPLPDAFVCANDSMAMAVCLKLAEHGYSIPEDVIVTGFDGMELEKYHNPRLTTAIRDNAELAEAVFKLIAHIISEPDIKPYDVILEYTPTFSESCGCVERDASKSNRILSEYVRNYSYARVFEEDMNSMSNKIGANPTLENARYHLRKKSFGGTVLCITDDFYHYCTDTSGADDIQVDSRRLDYPEKMHVFTSRSKSEILQESMEYLTEDILPDLFGNFDGNNTLVIMPIHSLDLPIGMLITYYVESDLYFDQTYSFAMATNRCLEMVRTHERMAFLNRKLEFMFTHDQLTKIYNRYGFYRNYRENFEKHSDSKKDAFIIQ